MTNLRNNLLHFFSKIIGIRNKKYEEKQKIMFFFLISVSLCIIALLAGLICFVQIPLAEIPQNPIGNSIICVCAAVLIMIGITLYLIFKKLQVLIFFDFMALLVCINGIHQFQHFYGTAGLLSGSPIPCVATIIGISFLVMKTNGIIFWTIVVIICLIWGFISDVFFADIVGFYNRHYSQYEGWPLYQRLIGIYTYGYFPIFINIIVFLIVLISQKKHIEKSDKVIDTLGDSILSLNFENKDIITLESKNQLNLTKNEVLFKGIIKNLKIYKLFLPDTITKGGTTDENLIKKDGKSSKESIDSTNTISTNGSDGSEIIKIIEEQVRDVQKNRNIQFGLNRKEVVVMKVNSNLFSSYNLRKDKESIDSFYKDLQEFSNTVSSIAYQHKGIIHDTKEGINITITFNAQRIAVNPAIHACECAFQIISASKKINPSISIIKVDNMVNGIIKTKFRSVYHLLDPYLSIFKEIFRKENSLLFENHSGNIFVDSKVKEDIKYSFNYKQILIQSYNSYGSIKKKEDIFRIYQKNIDRSNVKGEWFYHVDVQNQKSEKDKQKKFDQYNQIWETIKEEKIIKAEEKLNLYNSEYQDDDRDTLFLLNYLNSLKKAS